MRPEFETPPPAWFAPDFLWVVGCSYRGMPTSPQPVRNPVGAAMLCRAATLRDAGGFSSRLRRTGAQLTGCEETELSIRVARSAPGSRIVYEPGVGVDHVVPADRLRRGYFARRCFGEGRSKAILSSIAGGSDALASGLAQARRASRGRCGRWASSWAWPPPGPGSPRAWRATPGPWRTERRGTAGTLRRIPGAGIT